MGINKNRQVAITGVGTVNPLGQSPDETWKNLCAGKSGITPITLFNPQEYNLGVIIAGQVKNFDPKKWGMGAQEVRRFDRATHLAIAAAYQAIAQANFGELKEHERRRFGVLVSTGVGGLGTTLREQDRLRDRGADRVNVFTVPGLMPNAAANTISMLYGFTGGSYPLCVACAAGLYAMGHAYKMILHDEADVVIAGGAEAPILPLTMAAFGNMHALSTRPVVPERASCPFDNNRDGFVIAEGATIFVLEELNRARRRGAPILGTVLGYGETTDAYDLTQPKPGAEEATRAMRIALEDAGEYTDIVYIHAHGTSTPKGDAAETLAIANTFGARASAIPIGATKSMTGHSLGAAGPLGALAALGALRTGNAPGTTTLDMLGSDCVSGLDYIYTSVREIDVGPHSAALVNAFAFGGSNAALIIGHGE